MKLIAGQFGIKQIMYGDTNIVGAAPIVCILPAVVGREFASSSAGTRNSFEVNLLVYSTSLREGMETVQRNLDILTEDIGDYFSVKASGLALSTTLRGVEVTGDLLGGLITQGLSSRTEYDFKVLGDERMRMNRIIFTAMSRTGLVE
ncbi:MAG: hypothetical protein ABL876_00180 [Chitinophagaceae bacterium]